MPLRGHFHNTRNTGIANAYAAVEGGADVARCEHRRHRRLPVRAGRDRQHPDRGSPLHARPHGHRDRRRPRARRSRPAGGCSSSSAGTVPGMLVKAGPFPGAKETDVTYRLGIDVGGTFTDLLLVNEKTGGTWSAKVPSTPEDQSIGVLSGLMRICKQAGIDPQGHRTRDARHDGRDQHGADQLGRARRARHDPGLSPGAADRALLRAGRPRRLGHLQQVAADGAAQAHDRG